MSGFAATGSCNTRDRYRNDHLIGGLCYAHSLPVHPQAGLPECYSHVQRRSPDLYEEGPARPVRLPELFGTHDTLLLYSPFLDIPCGVQHLQFGDAADADQYGGATAEQPRCRAVRT